MNVGDEVRFSKRCDRELVLNGKIGVITELCCEGAIIKVRFHEFPPSLKKASDYDSKAGDYQCYSCNLKVIGDGGWSDLCKRVDQITLEV